MLTDRVHRSYNAIVHEDLYSMDLRLDVSPCRYVHLAYVPVLLASQIRLMLPACCELFEREPDGIEHLRDMRDSRPFFRMSIDMREMVLRIVDHTNVLEHALHFTPTIALCNPYIEPLHGLRDEIMQRNRDKKQEEIPSNVSDVCMSCPERINVYFSHLTQLREGSVFRPIGTLTRSPQR